MVGAPNTQTVHVGYGKCVKASRSYTLAVFAVEAPFKRTLLSKLYPKVGSTSRISVGAHADVDGMLFSEQVAVPEGATVLLQARTTRNGSSIADGAIFVRVRKEGTLFSIVAPLGPGVTPCNMFTGRGDILTPDEIAASNIELSPGYISGFMDAEEIAECLTVQVHAAAIVSAPVFEVVHPGGDTSKAAVAMDTRRIPRKIKVRR